MARRLRPQIRFALQAVTLFSGVMMLVATPTKTYADDNTPSQTIVKLSKAGTLNTEQIKQQFIENNVPSDDNKKIDTKKSVTVVNPTSSNTARVTVYPAVKDKNGKVSLNAKPVTGTVLVAKEVKHKPTLELSSDKVVINNGDKFNAQSYISQVTSDNGKLPALDVDASDVNTSKDGIYEVNYKAIDTLGQTEEKTLQVEVKTPDEVIEARKKAAEEKAKKEAEEQAKKDAEQKAKEEAEQQAKEQAEQEARAVAEAQTATAVTQAPSISAPVVSAGSATGQSIVATARQLIGSPYVSGGASPAGFDCSGFTQYVFGLNGVSLNRTAASQASNGYQIPADQAQPGDLVLWQGHAAIYEGNGYVIHAMNPARGVRESALSNVAGSGAFMGFYRVNGVN